MADTFSDIVKNKQARLNMGNQENVVLPVE